MTARADADDADVVRLVVGAGDDGVRLDVMLAAALGVSRSAAAQRIDDGRVLVGGRPARRSRTVVAGEAVEVLAPPAAAPVTVPDLPPVRYRDEHLLVLAKPPGLVVHAGAGHAGDTLVDALLAAGIPLAEGGDPTRPGIVHRLDRDTSGLLVVASSAPAYEGLVRMLGERRIERRYLALLAGSPAERRGVVDAPIGRHPVQRTRFAVVEDGRPARTRFRVLADATVDLPGGGRRTVASVVCALETGRTHQIRVHLDAVEAPVAGDPVYGSDGALAAALGLSRPALHAAHLAFTHPVSGAPVTVTEPLPADLVEAWRRAGLALPADGAAVDGP